VGTGERWDEGLTLVTTLVSLNRVCACSSTTRQVFAPPTRSVAVLDLLELGLLDSLRLLELFELRVLKVIWDLKVTKVIRFAKVFTVIRVIRVTRM
jgi:hypothetical protein